MRRAIQSSVLTAKRLALVSALFAAGCSLVASPADRLFAERNFAAARDAYLDVLEDRDDGPRVEVALYHLGLIYLQPQSDLYDPEAAAAALTRLTYLRPRSEFAARASLLLSLQIETARLREAVQAQMALGREAEKKLAALRNEATETEAQSEDQSKKVGQLGNRIAGLKAQIEKLREELQATDSELTEREQELERLKSIDLEDSL